MPNAEIRETTVTPDADGSIVRLHISDVPLEDEYTPAIRILIEAKLPDYEPPLLLGQLQREAMKIAQNALTPILEKLAKEIGGSRFDLNPKPRG